LAGILDFGILDLTGITDYDFKILANLKYFSFKAIFTINLLLLAKCNFEAI
jgi:hypothetical protein